jgi:uncharacterized protein YdeI (YjbR/CyaY-like superfamily)
VSDRYPQFEITSRAQWRGWLEANHASSSGVWLVTYKKADGERHLSHEAIVQEALAFGWVDSRSRGLDDARSQLLVTPRKPRSGWSRVNKQHVEQIQAAGRMHAAGQAVVDAAVADGSWTALDAVESLLEPDDLGAALDADPVARLEWDAFPRSAKRAILEWIVTAKTPETRAGRVAQTAKLASHGIRANQPGQTKPR